MSLKIKEVKWEQIDKSFQFEQEQGLNVNTQNSANASRNSANSEWEYIEASFATPTWSIVININGDNYLIDVEKL